MGTNLSDHYTPGDAKRERTGAIRTMSESVRGQTESGDSLLAILNRLHVSCDGDRVPLRITNEFWPDGKPVYLMPDARIHDGRYFDGVFEVDGDSHKTKGSARWDERKDAYYAGMKLWVARVPNKEVKGSNVRAILESHRRRVDQYGGAVG